MLSARDPMRRRQPVERPLDVVGLELLVSITQALLAGILLALATQLGGDARAYGLPVPGLLAVLGVVVGAGWLVWLTGGSGAIMAAVGLATSVLAGALWLLALQDAALPRLDPLVGLITVACALYGLAAGVFLDGPHRAHWKGGVSQPHRGVPQTRATPARFSPPVQKVVDEHLSDLHLPQVKLPQVSLPSAPRVSMPGTKRASTPGDAAAGTPVADGLAIAAPVIPQSPTVPSDVDPGPDASATVDEVETPEVVVPVADAVEPITPEVTAPAAEATVPQETLVGPAPDAPTEAVTTAVPTPHQDTPSGAAPAPAADGEVTPDEAGPADPEAPTEPVARPPVQWPRPIEPRGHTGAHTADPDA